MALYVERCISSDPRKTAFDKGYASLSKVGCEAESRAWVVSGLFKELSRKSELCSMYIGMLINFQ